MQALYLRAPSPPPVTDFKTLAAEANRTVECAEIERERKQREEITAEFRAAAKFGDRSIHYHREKRDIHPAIVSELTEAGYTFEPGERPVSPLCNGQVTFPDQPCSVITLPKK